MRRSFKLLVALIVVFISFFFTESFVADAQEQAEFSPMLLGGKTEEFYANQAESIAQYNKLLERFSVQNRSVAGEKVYDSRFGGAYLNDDGELIVLLTENTNENQALVKEYTEEPKILIATCKYSYNELNRIINTINLHLEELRKLGADISSIYTDVMNNCVVIKVRNLNEYKESEIRKIVDSDCMVFQNTNEIVEYQDSTLQVDMKGGFELRNIATSKTATLGFGAIRNGVRGYVTASHFGRSIGQQISYNETIIGTVKQSGYYPNTYADAAFIESNGAASPTNMIMGGYYCTAASTLEYPQNTSILMYGNKSGLQSGTIYSYNHTYVPYNPEDYTSTDHVLAIYYSQNGDSGGPVFIYTGTSNGKLNCTLIGIHSATARVESAPGTSSFAKYGNIVRMLNVTALTQ